MFRQNMRRAIPMRKQGMVWRGTMASISRFAWQVCVMGLSCCLVLTATTSEPQPPGKLVNLGDHRLHVNCTGNGSPTVVIESGLGDSPSTGFWCSLGFLVFLGSAPMIGPDTHGATRAPSHARLSG